MKRICALAIGVASLALLLGAAAEKPVFTGLRLELFVSDVPKSLAFYRDVLGFEVERQEQDYVALRSGAARIALNRADGLAKQHFFNPELQQQRRGLGAEIVLEVDDIAAHFERAKASGHPILSPLKKRPWGLTDYRVADPDGYYLRISSREE